MTAPTPPAVTGTVLTPTDYAQLGARMGRVGFSGDEIAAFMANFEQLAASMARDLIHAAAADLLELVGHVHQDTAMNIYDQLATKNQTGLVRMHDACANIALSEAQSAPRRRRR